MIYKLTDENSSNTVALAVSTLIKGAIIVYPTETFYGIGAKYDNFGALSKVFNIKKREPEKPLPLIIGNIDELYLLTDFITCDARNLIKKYWPGPLTIIFKALPNLSQNITFNGKVAVRMPGESFALDLARAAGFPITATSANISDMPPAETASAVVEFFNDSIDLVIDGGKTPGGLPSTIVDACEGLKIVRKGALDITI
jgi:L-threonylcarbamoyladenylate synthase